MTRAPAARIRTHPPRLPLFWAWLLALALHALALWLLDSSLDRPARTASLPLDIVLVPAEQPAPPVPPPLPATRPVPPEPVPVPPVLPPLDPVQPPAPEPPAPISQPTAATAPTPAPTPVAAAPVVQTRAQQPAPATTSEPRIVLFDPDGSLRVSDSVLQGDPTPIADYIPMPREIPPWETRTDPLVYEATAFEPIWKPDQETLLDEFFRKQTMTKKFTTPWGTKVTCSWVLIIGGCAW